MPDPYKNLFGTTTGFGKRVEPPPGLTRETLFEVSPFGEADKPAAEPLFRTPPIAPTPQRPNTNLFGIDLENYKPDTRASDMFIDLMENMPQRTEPGLGRQILAGLTSLGPEGQAGAERVRYGPYLRQMGDFKLRADLLGNLAAAERSTNANERLLITQLFRDAQTQRRLELQEQEFQGRERARQASTEMARIRTRLAEIASDRTLSDEQKLALQAKYRLDLERLQQDNRLELEGERAELDQALERMRQEGRIELEQEQSAIEAEQPELPTQTKVRQYNIARQIFNSDPDARRFIVLGNPGTNDFTLRLPSALRGATREQYRLKYEELAEAIYGPEWRQLTGSGENTTPPPTTTRPPTNIPRPPTPGTSVVLPGNRPSNMAPPPAGPRAGTTPQQNVRTRTQVNQRTGQTRTQVSTDGGVTWRDQ